MIKNNPGCILPFYRRKIWQRHRLHGQDLQPFGLKAPNPRLIPFQLRGTTGTATTVTWKLINAVAETTAAPVELTMSASLLQIDNVEGGGWYVTYFANDDLDPVPDCGYWYAEVTVDGVPYYSELMHLDGVSSTDTVGLAIADCDVSGGVLFAGIVQNDSITSGTIEEESIYYFAPSSGTWEYLGENDGTIQWVESDGGPIEVKREVRLTSGRVLVCYGAVTYTVGDACETLAVNVYAQDVQTAEQLWRIRFYSATDKGGVLYSNGFQQQLYLKLVVFGTPTVEVDEDVKKDGFGQEKTVAATIRENLPFETTDIPDYIIGALVELGYAADEIYLEETFTAFAYQLIDMRFTAERISIGLNKGVFTSKLSQSVIACQDNTVLI